MNGRPFQLSGCYQFNGGASPLAGRSFVDPGSGQSVAALENPIHRLEEPIFLAAEPEGSADAAEAVRFTLGVDIDGVDPLHVVSGTVAVGPPIPGTPSGHFIGRVTANEEIGGGRSLGVSDLKLTWPGGIDTIQRLTIELAGSPETAATATVTFVADGDRTYGPYQASRESAYFREVEVDVDREANAIECEPFDTHLHPDRPADLNQEALTLEAAFAKAGIRISRSPGSGTIVNEGAGEDKRWSYSELHDSMQKHWDAFANKPQWKMWLFLAELGESEALGGVMFDGEIDEPGGVDRQGVAIFTRCPYFHTPEGDYPKANPPPAEAVRRELFFNMVHEVGHAFNLAHSFQKGKGEGWSPPSWMPLKTNSQALSWMNYPDQAHAGGPAGNASWFYQRFRFQFEPDDLLFLRHAPETYVEMGGEAWFQQHGRVARIDVDNRLELVLRSRKMMPLSHGGSAAFVELGEPVLLELRLRNRSGLPVLVHGNLDPSDGLVAVAVTHPRGERRPFLPIDHTRTLVKPRLLQPEERLYEPLDMTIGSFGFPFKEPGAYRIEASYTNLDGTTAAAVLQLYVRPAPHPDVAPVVNEMFDARCGRTLYVDGTRVMADVNEKLDWIRGRLDELIGKRNPISIHLTTVRFKPLAGVGKVVEPEGNRLHELGEEPDVVVKELRSVLVEQGEAAADTMGHIWYQQALDTYTRAAEKVNQIGKACDAQRQMVKMFEGRGVVQNVMTEARERLKRFELLAPRKGARKARSAPGGSAPA